MRNQAPAQKIDNVPTIGGLPDDGNPCRRGDVEPVGDIRPVESVEMLSISGMRSMKDVPSAHAGQRTGFQAIVDVPLTTTAFWRRG